MKRFVAIFLFCCLVMTIFSSGLLSVASAIQSDIDDWNTNEVVLNLSFDGDDMGGIAMSNASYATVANGAFIHGNVGGSMGSAWLAKDASVNSGNAIPNKTDCTIENTLKSNLFEMQASTTYKVSFKFAIRQDCPENTSLQFVAAIDPYLSDNHGRGTDLSAVSTVLSNPNVLTGAPTGGTSYTEWQEASLIFTTKADLTNKYLGFRFGNNTADPYTKYIKFDNIRVETGNFPITGISGDCTWKLNGTELTISGNGATADYYKLSNTTAQATPWGTDITKVTIEEGVTGIGKTAFFNCENLTSISIADSVKNIGSEAFYNTAYYNNSSNWTDGVLYIGTCLIDAKQDLVSGHYVIADGTTLIADSAFRLCEGLTEITIPSSVSSINISAFDYCFNLSAVNIFDLKAWCEIDFGSSYSNPLGYAHKLYLNGVKITNLDIPEGTRKIGDYAFFEADSIISVTIPDTIKSIGDYSFANNTNLKKTNISDLKAWCEIDFSSTTSSPVQYSRNLFLNGVEIKGDLVIPEGTEKIGKSAFYYIDDITSVSMPDSVKIIEERAFNGCSGIESVKLSKNLTDICNYAFLRCSSLTEISFPETLCNIGDSAFYYCTSLNSITLPDKIVNICFNALDGTGYVDSNGNWENGALYIGKHLLKTNKNELPVNYVVKSGTVNIAQRAFSKCSGLISLVIPDTVQRIDKGAFYGCRALKEVYYCGTQTMWNTIVVPEENEYKAKIYCDVSGLKCIYNGWYYFENGDIVRNAWRMSSDNWLYFGADGSMKVNSWLYDGGKWYYLDVNGCMVTNKWMKDSKGWVYLGSSGAMLTNAWCTDSSGWCYVGADGYAVTNCWKKDSHGWIWLNHNGSMTKSAWVKDGGKWYYLDANGYMVSNQWRKDSKGWVYLGSNGAMLTNAWCTDSKGWCYVGADGYAVTNCWKKDSKGWIWLDANGSMTKSAWVKDGGKWYYLDANGYMLANTSRYIRNKTYYFNVSGVCTNP